MSRAADEFRALCPSVGQFQNPASSETSLNVEVPVLQVGCSQIALNCKG